MDNRNFTQIWKSLSTAEREAFSSYMLRAGVTTRFSIWRWAKGARPYSLAVRRKATQVLKNLGHDTDEKILFPEK